MYKLKVAIDTHTDVTNFVNIANSIEEPVFLEDGTGFRANAKSLIGVMYGKFEFETLWVVSECEHLNSKFNKFTV